MNVPPLTRAQVREVDQRAMADYGMSGLVLMENAGRGAADVIDRVADAGDVVILCGSGNNGGDGYVIARHLELMGRSATILSLVDFALLQGDALANANVVRAACIPCQYVDDVEALKRGLGTARTVVECLLGTGARGAPRGLMGDAVRIANGHDATRIAIDIPAGLDCDTGQMQDPTFRADHTITFVAAKAGFFKGDAGKTVGRIHPVGIGVPMKLLREAGLATS